MYSCWLLLLLGLSMGAAEDVIDLDNSNFDEAVNVDIMLVEFFAPWCGHCKRLAPEYEQAATKLLKSDPPVPLAKVDCPANSALCQRFGVSGYPTLKIFRNGELSADYSGPRTADGIVSYMNKQAGPSFYEVSSVDELNKKLEATLIHCIVGFFTEEGDALQKAFTQAANKERENFKFILTSDPDTLTEFGYSDQVVIFQPTRMISKLEPSQLPYTGEADSGDLVEFIKENFMGEAGVRTVDNMAFFQAKPLLVAYYDVDYERNAKGSNYWRNRILKVAKDVDDITFCVSDKGAFQRELSDLGLENREAPVVVGLFDNSGKYAMEKEFSIDNLKEFVNLYREGSLELYMKSEPIPENDGPVSIVVGRNFDEVVNAEGKDVLIEFYAPWCGHCKQLAPKYDELGEKLKNDPNVVIAKMDATANDYPPIYEVRGYPSLYWVPAGKKDKPVKYEGGREVSDFLKYIKENATNKPVVLEEGKKKKSDEL